MNTITQITRLLISVATAIALSACSKPARVAGKVIDSRNNPISKATVSIEGTQFQTTTDDHGDYSIQYVPGKFTIRASAPDYLFAQLSLEVTQATTFPAAPITLRNLPDRAQWKDYLTKELPGKTIRDHITGSTYRFSEFAQIQGLSVDNFEQTGEREVIGTVTARYKALMDFDSSNIRSAFQPFSGFDRGQRNGETWEQKFRIRLQFKNPNTWSWEENLPNQLEAAQPAAADITTAGATQMQWMDKGKTLSFGDEHSEASIITLTITGSALEIKATGLDATSSFADIISLAPNKSAGNRLDINEDGYPSYWFKTKKERDHFVVDLDRAIQVWITNNPEARKSPYGGIRND